MTPDLSYTTEREGESSTRIIKETEKKIIQYENSFSDKLQQQAITAVQWGYSDSRLPCDEPKQALILLLSVVGNICC